MNIENDVQRGREALTYFHNAALAYPQNYSMSFDELNQKLSDLSHGQFLSGLGFAISSGSFSDGSVRDAMKALADQGQGRLPVHYNDFFTALIDQSQKLSFLDAVSATAKGTASDIVSGVQKVGDVTIETLKNAGGLVVWLPLVLFGGVILYVYHRAK